MCATWQQDDEVREAECEVLPSTWLHVLQSCGRPADVKRRGTCEDDDTNERRFKESVKVSVCLPNFKAEGEVSPPHARGRHNSINTIAGR